MTPTHGGLPGGADFTAAGAAPATGIPGSEPSMTWG
jgi:hypothetical protein